MSDERDERAAAIRARLDAASPGPWWRANETSLYIKDANDEQGIYTARCFKSDADAELIANAPADLEWALEQLAEKERDLVRLREENTEMRRGIYKPPSYHAGTYCPEYVPQESGVPWCKNCWRHVSAHDAAALSLLPETLESENR